MDTKNLKIRYRGCAFLSVEAVTFSGSHYMVYDMRPIEIVFRKLFKNS